MDSDVLQEIAGVWNSTFRSFQIVLEQLGGDWKGVRYVVLNHQNTRVWDGEISDCKQYVDRQCAERVVDFLLQKNEFLEKCDGRSNSSSSS